VLLNLDLTMERFACPVRELLHESDSVNEVPGLSSSGVSMPGSLRSATEAPRCI
jgi:hypothetical protein